MKSMIILLLSAAALAGCGNDGKGLNGTNDSAQQIRSSVALDAIDSSAIMNDSTRLPKDSIATTVAH